MTLFGETALADRRCRALPSASRRRFSCQDLARAGSITVEELDQSVITLIRIPLFKSPTKSSRRASRTSLVSHFKSSRMKGALCSQVIKLFPLTQHHTKVIWNQACYLNSQARNIPVYGRLPGYVCPWSAQNQSELDLHLQKWVNGEKGYGQQLNIFPRRKPSEMTLDQDHNMRSHSQAVSRARAFTHSHSLSRP
jgi:hypothetical protein